MIKITVKLASRLCKGACSCCPIRHRLVLRDKVFIGSILCHEGKVLHTSQVTHRAGAYPGFCGTRWPGIFLFPLHGMLVHSRVIPSIKLVGTHSYTWVKRGIVRVKCLVQKHSTMFSDRTPNPDRSIRSPAHWPSGHRPSNQRVQ